MDAGDVIFATRTGPLKPWLGLLVSFAGTIIAPAQAADLDRGPPPPPVVGFAAPYPGPVVLPAGPSCRLVPQPQMNLYNEVTRSRPIWVCISRGVYADSLWPYTGPH